MKLKELTIPDEVFEAYEKQAEELQGAGRSVSAQELMVAQLEKFAGIRSFDRIIVVDSATRCQLEKILTGGSSLNGSSDLLDRVQKLAILEIGEVKVDFTIPEWNQLKRYAGKTGKSLAEIVRTVVSEIGWRFFDHLPS